jgi:UDP-N-acetylglucosamine 1-carboxyvinyltransferase
MEEIVIRGGRKLHGVVRVSGAKNAALPIMAASLLTRGETVLYRVPRLRDVDTMALCLSHMGVGVDWVGPEALRLTPDTTLPRFAPCERVHDMRGSICVLGPLLATRGAAVLPLPGGCVIGERPIDLHVKGLQALGAEIICSGGYVIGRADRLRGTRIDLSGPHGSTALGTANVMMAAVLAEGRTVIESAAREPEIQDVAEFLNCCGARIMGIGTDRLTIDGVERLQGAKYTIIPDRIEAATYMAAAGITGGEVRLEGVRVDHMREVLAVLERAGLILECDGELVSVSCRKHLYPVAFETAPYPGVPTDVQPQLSALLTLADGRSSVHESVYHTRFTHVDALVSMGARVARGDGLIGITGVKGLTGEHVHAADLRAGAALVLAGLAAHGTTVVTGVDQIDRGYDGLVKKFSSLGADIERREAGLAGLELRKTA